ncbi:hypothetical protein Tther_00522 [Tepidimonas thermarum]|uniref:Uncharacterized protein n=1 Tax=Tepidimonas thermarum TaxID=335431 RepID=A0A554X6L5_9BURK|nr:hypothetical protein [Tepidimonas thermarum]TSE31463.1 hypothetical protein Tther_00522 [Tepidimonas thermarum]
MLESVHDQAAGLLAWRLQPPARVLAVVASGRGAASLELLWRLRQGCAGLGLEVAVVEDEPGRWGAGPERGGVWLWHTPPEEVLRWWPPEAGRPLVGWTLDPAALVAAYQAVKTLWRGGLAPVVVALPDGAASAAGAAWQAARSALERTCATHLGWVPPVWTLGYDERVPADPAVESVLCKALDAAWMWDTPAGVGSVVRPC